MVTFNNMGRMGNFLFEAATAYAYAKKHNLDFTVPNTTNDPYWNPLYLQHLVQPIQPRRFFEIKEHGHGYQELPFFEHYRNHNIKLNGYWQTEKYFKQYRDDILKDFAFSWNPHNNVSIHVRRGDYLKYPHKHPVVPDEYYDKSIDYFYNKGHRDFFVYSDDIPWCRNYFINRYHNLSIAFWFSDLKNEVDDLIGISNCAGGHINSSSTFSWWGAWLNQNPQKIVITPKLWFMPGHNGLYTDDIIPETWIKM